MSNDERKKKTTQPVSNDAVERQAARIAERTGMSRDEAKKLVVDAIEPVNRERRGEK